MSNLHDSICNVCNTEYDVFLNKKNVVGIALGNKIVNGIDTGENCIHVLVEKKINKDALSQSDIIDKDYSGIKTDVIEIGKIEAQALTSKVRPLKFGYSVGPYNLNMAGTAGCLVSDGRRYFILSNNHVLVNTNSLPLGTSILQPAKLDGGVFPKDAIASLYKYSKINFPTATTRPENVIDAAIAYVSNANLVTPYIELVGYVKGVIAPTINMAVKKSGRTSSLTTGTITSINATITVSYSAGKTALFKNQILSTAMSLAGDSGSLVLNNNNYAVGLLFAGSSVVTAFNPIPNVLSSLGVKLVTQ